MRLHRRGFCLQLLPLSFSRSLLSQQAQKREPDVVFVPTPDDVVEQMLDLAKVRKGDVVYDLGCGDGRIVIAAAQREARAVGVDIDPQRILQARRNAKLAGLGPEATFIEADLFETDLRDATVVMLYLLPRLNVKLKPKLLAELKPGARIVSHSFDMGDWKPDEEVDIAGDRIYLWRVPEKKQAPP
jgi:SAM-dependent methyltransferase